MTTQPVELEYATSLTSPARRQRASIRQWWHRLWFEPTTPANLGFSRMLFFGLMFWFFRSIDYTVWGNLPASFQNANPILLFELLNIGSPSIKALAVTQFLFKSALVFGCIGLFTRLSCLIALIAGTYVLGMPNTFGKTGHGDGILILAIVVLTLSRCGDAWSIDAIARSWRRGPKNLHRPVSGEYTWPVRCIWLLSALVFLNAGLSKLRLSGFRAWVFSPNLANMILQHRYKSSPPTDLGVWIAAHPYLCYALAGGTIIVEVLFPLALISRIARWALVPGMFLMQVGIGLTMGVVFTQFMFIYLFWVPWDALGRWMQRVGARCFQKRYVFYDGGCGLCRKTVTVLWHLDVLRRCEPYDVVHEWAEIEARFPQLDRDAALEDMHTITHDGRVYRGYDAYRSIAWTLPLAWPLLPILYLPPVRFLGWKIYRYVATHRHDKGCELPHASEKSGL